MKNVFLYKILYKRFAEKSAPNPSTFKTKIKYRLNVGVIKIPHFSKVEKGGEDAYAVHDGMISVADGVGGWNESGVDPAKYSNELCGNIKKEFVNNGHLYYHQLKRLFTDACNKTKSIGSATFCMCVLDLESDHLHTLNMGDSGYMILRGNNNVNNPNKTLNDLVSTKSSNDVFDIVFKSEEQQHSFNFPYQVGTHGDRPEDAYVNVHKIQENDIIVLGTDGLWDNLFDNQIVNVIKPFYQTSNQLSDLNLLAEMLGQTCEKFSLDERYKSPFSVRSRGLFLGGKPDDITIIIAQIVRNDLI